jgi:hypothetical protein
MRLAVVTTSASSSSNNNNNIPFAIAAIYSRTSSENRGDIRRLFVGRGGGSYFRLGSHPHRRETTTTKQKKAPHQQNDATPSETNTQGTQIPSQSHSS